MTTKPDCQEGQSCGLSCISRKDTCSGSVAKDVAEALVSSATKSRASRAAELPEGVTVSSSSGHRMNSRGDMSLVTTDTYSMRVGGHEIDMNIYKSKGAKEVDFDVNNSGDISGDVSKKDSAVIAIKLSRIFAYEISKSEEGDKFMTSASTSDGQGAKRALAYHKMGFSLPLDYDNDLDLDEYMLGTVKSGKLVPNYNGSDPSEEQQDKAIKQLRSDRKAKK